MIEHQNNQTNKITKKKLALRKKKVIKDYGDVIVVALQQNVEEKKANKYWLKAWELQINTENRKQSLKISSMIFYK